MVYTQWEETNWLQRGVVVLDLYYIGTDFALSLWISETFQSNMMISETFQSNIMMHYCKIDQKWPTCSTLNFCFWNDIVRVLNRRPRRRYYSVRSARAQKVGTKKSLPSTCNIHCNCPKKTRSVGYAHCLFTPPTHTCNMTCRCAEWWFVLRCLLITLSVGQDPWNFCVRWSVHSNLFQASELASNGDAS